MCGCQAEGRGLEGWDFLKGFSGRTCFSDCIRMELIGGVWLSLRI